MSALAVTRTGSGVPVLLVHGLGHHRHTWAPVARRLTDGHEVLAIDLPGFGESRDVRLRWPTVPALADRIARELERWGIDRPHVVGNSLGGAIALELAARGRARSVTALSPGGFIGSPDRLQTIGALTALRLRSLLPLGLQHAIIRSRAGSRVYAAGLYADHRRLTPEAALADAVAIKYAPAFERTLIANTTYGFRGAPPVPTTIAWADRDRILPVSTVRRVRERVPGARVEILERCGHVPMVDAPDAIVRLVRETIATADGSEADRLLTAARP
ncbi:MAG: alpha/beta fold hydrolase [Solirubrobacteraceae bacterium]|nr:alpha/beta fold hydrolase [Solirubrobacteraceae bacterium]